jgi:hypothetical protein
MGKSKHLAIILGMLAVPFITGLFFMLLWNWLMPYVFGLVGLTYWQSFGFVILSNILFKSNDYKLTKERINKDK